MRMTEMLEPYGCRWCGTARRSHGRRWDELAGVHAWQAPHQWQIKDRMRARRDSTEGRTWRWQR